MSTAMDPSSADNATEVDLKLDAKEATADTSTADEGAKEQPKSMLDAVKLALEPAKEEAETKVGEESPTTKTGDTEADKTTEQEVPFHKHPRWQEKLANEKALTAERDALKEKATRLDQFTEVVKRAGLESKEVDTGFEIMRLMKHDPAKAYEMLTPFYRELQQFVGETLPEDLNKKVEEGLVDRETASELAQQRAKVQHVEVRTQEDRARQQHDVEAEAERQMQELSSKVTAAITAWDDQWKKSDPDYQKKVSLVEDRIVKMLNEKTPGSPDEAIEMVKAARKSVEDTLAGIITKKSTVRTVTGGSSANNNVAAPKTLKEAIALAAARGG